MSHIWPILPSIPIVVAAIGTIPQALHAAVVLGAWHALAWHASGVTFVVAALIKDPGSSF